MTTREHLIYHLQDLYAFHRDYLPLLDSMHHECGNERLRELLQRRHDDMRSEMETLEQALNLLGAQYRQERNALVPGLKEATERLKHQMNPSQEQLDIHAALEAIKVGRLSAAGYQGDMELAQAIGEPDVAKLLGETLDKQGEGLQALRDFLPPFLQDVTKGEARRAA